jgi:ABC-type protease/lipase transport system fused ATPase/permease subunit
MALAMGTFIDLSFLLLYIAMVFVLFDRQIFDDTIFGKFILNCIHKYKSHRREHKRKKDVYLDMDIEAKKGLTTPFYDNKDQE